MDKEALDYYEDHVVFKTEGRRFRFETFVRRAKKSLFELVIVIPESITEANNLRPLSTNESRKVIHGMKKALSSGLNQAVTLEFRNTFKHGLLEKISDAFTNYKRPKEEADETTNRRSFKGFTLQNDNATAVNKELGVEIKLEVGFSGSSLFYKRDEFTLTMPSGGDILSEILYSNTVVLETPFRWDSPNDLIGISNEEMEVMKEHIKAAMELYDSLVFFKEVPRKTDAEKSAYIQRQLDLINQRKLKKASNEN